MYAIFTMFSGSEVLLLHFQIKQCCIFARSFNLYHKHHVVLFISPFLYLKQNIKLSQKYVAA